MKKHFGMQLAAVLCCLKIFAQSKINRYWEQSLIFQPCFSFRPLRQTAGVSVQLLRGSWRMMG